MDLSKILTISGKPGLYKIIASTRNGVLLESLIDGKRMPAFPRDTISSLNEISILCEEENIEIKNVLKSIFDAENEKEIENLNGLSKTELEQKFAQFVPTYDREKVYHSDMKKLFAWYNLLLKNGLIDREDDAVAPAETEAQPEIEVTEE